MYRRLVRTYCSTAQVATQHSAKHSQINVHITYVYSYVQCIEDWYVNTVALLKYVATQHSAKHSQINVHITYVYSYVQCMEDWYYGK